MAIKRNVAKLGKKAASTKAEEPKNEVTTVDEEAKKRVEQLIEDVDTPTGNDDGLLDIEEPTTEDLNNLDWLQEQLNKLSTENETLKKEALEAKEGYKKIFNQLKNAGGATATPSDKMIPDSQLKNGIIELFMDVQNNFLGRNQERRRYTNIVPVPFMKKMVKEFPFLKEHQRF